VLAENGEKLAEFTRNSSDRIRFVKHGNVYFQETDEETGVEEIVKYSFTLEG
jgi:hypothetical protein